MNDFLSKLADRLRTPDAEIVSADEVADWPGGKLDELVNSGVLKETQCSSGVVCQQCDENCFIEPDIRTNPNTGEVLGVFVCTRNPDIGRIEIDLERLRQWRIDRDKLKDLGFLKKIVKRKKRKISSELTPRETEAYSLVFANDKTQLQAAMEMRCTSQNVSKLLKKAEAKIKLKNSRSVNFDKTQKLPEDKRGQVTIPKNL